MGIHFWPFCQYFVQPTNSLFLTAIAAGHPDVVEELAALLKKIKDDGRTRQYHLLSVCNCLGVII